jgi:uncharacterized protein (TIGR00255 family)
MIRSMTGYGTANLSEESLTINVEVKSLNSKFLDLTLRIPRGMTENELELRKLVNDRLIRGKVMLAVDYFDQGVAHLKQRYNEDLFIKYYQQLRRLSDRVIDTGADLFTLALNSPDVIINESTETLSEDRTRKIFKLIKEALDQCDTFRLEEGKALSRELHGYVQIIRDQLKSVALLDAGRIKRIRERIKGNLMQFVEEEAMDKNRLEQELVFYLEKLDITEEKVRLESHLGFFEEVLDQETASGKKLGFISQEMGREINTIGSKANDADIQKHVVVMKEELEKIKEQVLNIL